MTEDLWADSTKELECWTTFTKNCYRDHMHKIYAAFIDNDNKTFWEKLTRKTSTVSATAKLGVKKFA